MQPPARAIRMFADVKRIELRKTLVFMSRTLHNTTLQETKVFCFFFSKKKILAFPSGKKGRPSFLKKRSKKLLFL
jgi:hypothetical protein